MVAWDKEDILNRLNHHVQLNKSFICYRSFLLLGIKKMKVKCDHCGKEIVRKPSRIKRVKHHFCSQECFSKWYSLNFSGENSFVWKGGKVKRFCQTCGEEFEVWPSDLKLEHGKYCSRECFAKSLSVNWRGEDNPRWKGGKTKCFCKVCGKTFFVDPYIVKKGEGEYCSHKCHDRWRSENLKGENNPNWRGGKIKQICLMCGKEFQVAPSSVKPGRRKFCSVECHGKWQSENWRGSNCPTWKGGKIKRLCSVCGREFEVWLSVFSREGRGKFCSLSCARQGRKSFPTHHTKPELIFEAICKKNNLPFKYTGDGSFWIGKLNPDFVECNGKKIAIEIFSYWHDPLRRHCKVRYTSTYEGRKKILKKHGWKLVVFWQDDLERGDVEQFVLNYLREEKGTP